MRNILLLIILLQSTKSYSQLNLTRKIDVNVKAVALSDFLNQLQTRHGMLYSYAFDHVNDNCLVSLQATATPLMDVLMEVCRQCNLQFIVVGESVVFKRKIKNPAATLVVTDTYSPASTSPPIATDSSRINKPNWLTGYEFKIDSAKLKKYILIVDLPTQRQVGKPQPAKAGYGLFVDHALDFNSYDFKPRDMDFQNYRSSVNNGFGIGFFHRFAKKWFVSVGLASVKKNFTLHYNFQVFDPDDPFPIPAQTTLDIHYVEMPVSLGYSFFTRPHNALWISASLLYSTVTSKTEKTTYLNSGKPDTSYFLETTPSGLIGTAVGLVFNQDITSSSGIFIEPSYMIYTSAMNNEAMNASRAFRIRVGLAYKLKRNN